MRKALLIGLANCLVCAAAHASIPSLHKTNAFPEGERLVYSRMVAAYRNGQLEDLHKNQKILKEHYPNSVHIANGYYMLGALQYQQGHLGEALREFDQVVNRFIQSSKRSSALFAMGMTYKKLNLQNQANAVFQRVIQLYPGSPDSKRAWMELRMLNNKKG